MQIMMMVLLLQKKKEKKTLISRQILDDEGALDREAVMALPCT